MREASAVSDDDLVRSWLLAGRPVSAKGVVLDGRCCLLGRNDRGEWELLGGRVEPRETPIAAVRREVTEESGLVVRPRHRLLVEPFAPVPGSEVLIIAFECAVDRPGILRSSSEHVDVAWHALDALDALVLPDVYRRAVALATDPPAARL